jgi:hypothetical protein
MSKTLDVIEQLDFLVESREVINSKFIVERRGTVYDLVFYNNTGDRIIYRENIAPHINKVYRNQAGNVYISWINPKYGTFFGNRE